MLQNGPNCTFIQDNVSKNDISEPRTQNLCAQIYSLERVYFFENDRKNVLKKRENRNAKLNEFPGIHVLHGLALA